MKEQGDALIILSPGFASSEADTTCLPMQQELVKEIARRHPQLSVIVLSFHYPYHGKQYQWNGITVIPFGGKNKGGVAGMLLRKKIRAELKRLHRQYRIRGLLSFWLGECTWVGRQFALDHQLFHFTWILGQDARPGNHYVKRSGITGKELVALSESLQKEFVKNYGIEPFKVVAPGISVLPSTQQTRDIDIIGVGSLIELKQFDLFVQVLAGLKKDFPLIKAVLVGEGPERKKIQQLAAAAHVQENLEIKGMVSHDEVLALMQRSKILLHPSSYEGFSGVCMEALGSGTHVVSFCRAMFNDIDHWHIVLSLADMTDLVRRLLAEKLDHKPVIISSIRETAEKISALYGLSPENS